MKMVDNSVFNVVQSFPWEQNVIKIGLRKLKLKKIINNNIGFARKWLFFIFIDIILSLWEILCW